MHARLSFTGFDDIGSDFNSAQVHAKLPTTLEEASGVKSTKKKVGAEVFVETCTRCRGTGRYHHVSEHGTICLKCKGKGKIQFTSSPEQRAAVRLKNAKKKVDIAAANLKAVEDKHPELAAWWSDTGFEFALSLRGAAERTGRLSDAQVGAAMNCIAKLSAVKSEQALRLAAAEAAPELNLQSITAAMTKAREAGIGRPKMRLLAGDAGFLLSFAPDSGKWAGSLYAKDTEGNYLGRITNSRFYAARDTADTLSKAIIQACGSPLDSAVAYGRRTGTCSCCGRELTNKASIDSGIGPICQSKFF
jgi:hypothetical protein